MATKQTGWGRMRAGALALVLVMGFAGGAAADGDQGSGEQAGQGTVLLLPAAGAASVHAMTGHGVWAQTRVKAKQGYNSDYIFGLSKGVADSTMVPALKPLLFIITVPLDLVILPFALIGGFFG